MSATSSAPPTWLNCVQFETRRFQVRSSPFGRT
jgi:hypothetical protein